jgi:hypothetical protein
MPPRPTGSGGVGVQRACWCRGARGDREGLERFCRYCARPPWAAEVLEMSHRALLYKIKDYHIEL